MQLVVAQSLKNKKTHLHIECETVPGVAVSRHPATPTPGRGFGSDLAILGDNPRRE